MGPWSPQIYEARLIIIGPYKHLVTEPNFVAYEIWVMMVDVGVLIVFDCWWGPNPNS